MITVQDLIKKIKSYNPDTNESLITKAYILSKTAHGNQKRHSGDPYFLHPLEVALKLTDLKLDDESIATALLHDVAEDTEISLDEIKAQFGESIANLVDGVTKLGKIENVNITQKYSNNFHKLILAISNDIRVLLVKIADRLHNMHTLKYVPSKEKREKKARESLDIYAPLASKIGLNDIKDQIQDISFEVLNPDSRNYILEKLRELKQEKENLIQDIIKGLEDLLSLSIKNFELEGRQKTPYSIFVKMRSRNIDFENFKDIMAFRVITDSVEDCYKALGIINTSFKMIPGTFKDYISTPKENGYKSIHIVTIGPFNKKIEIQIRTKEMHEIAKHGVAAHWLYKDKEYSEKFSSTNPRWLQELILLFEHSDSSSEILKGQKITMLQDEVFCFTPDGDIYNLDKGSCLVDFAYAIHSEVGDKCVGAKVNGITTNLRYKINNGDLIEIVTSEDAKPSSNWLQFVITSKAKYHIKSFIKKEKYTEYVKLGKKIIFRYFSSKNLEINEILLEKSLSLIKNLKNRNLSELYFKITEGIVGRKEVLNAIYPDYKETAKNIDKENDNSSMPIQGLIPGMAVYYGGCCKPIPGDQITGVINTGMGIVIHTQNCPNLQNYVYDSDKIIDVCWSSNDSGYKFYPCCIKVNITNITGSFAEITNIIARLNTNILNIKLSDRSVDNIEMIIDLEIEDTEHLENLISNLRTSDKVLNVVRINNKKLD